MNNVLNQNKCLEKMEFLKTAAVSYQTFPMQSSRTTKLIILSFHLLHEGV